MSALARARAVYAARLLGYGVEVGLLGSALSIVVHVVLPL